MHPTAQFFVPIQERGSHEKVEQSWGKKTNPMRRKTSRLHHIKAFRWESSHLVVSEETHAVTRLRLRQTMEALLWRWHYQSPSRDIREHHHSLERHPHIVPACTIWLKCHILGCWTQRRIGADPAFISWNFLFDIAHRDHPSRDARLDYSSTSGCTLFSGETFDHDNSHPLDVENTRSCKITVSG